MNGYVQEIRELERVVADRKGEVLRAKGWAVKTFPDWNTYWFRTWRNEHYTARTFQNAYDMQVDFDYWDEADEEAK